MDNKVEEFNVADTLIGMADPEKESGNMQGLYDKRRNVKFPVKLMQILDEEAYHHIISWTPDGKAFAILKPTALEEQVLPAVFDNKQNGASKFKSFLRKLYRWGFLKKFHQSDDYTYYHKAFQRDNLSLCLTITRLPNVKKPSAVKSSVNSISNHAHPPRVQHHHAKADLAGGLSMAGGGDHHARSAQTDLKAAAARTDATILNAFKQKMLINEMLMKTDGINKAGSKMPGSLPSREHENSASVAAQLSLLNSSSLQGWDISSILQHDPFLLRNNNQNMSDIRSQILQNAAILQQSILGNDLSLSSTVGPHSSLATSLLAAESHANPATFLAQQSRFNPAVTNASLLGQSHTNDFVLNSVLGSVSAMNEAAAKQNLLLSSLGQAQALPQLPAGYHGHQHQMPPHPQQENNLHNPSSSSSPPQSSGKVQMIDHTHIMSGALNNFVERQKLLQTLKANMNGSGQVVPSSSGVPNLGRAHYGR